MVEQFCQRQNGLRKLEGTSDPKYFFYRYLISHPLKIVVVKGKKEKLIDNGVIALCPESIKFCKFKCGVAKSSTNILRPTVAKSSSIFMKDGHTLIAKRS